MNKNHIILGLCLVVAGMILAFLFRPAPQPKTIGDLTLDQEDEIKANLLTLEGRVDSLFVELDKRKAKEIVAEKAFKSETGVHKNKISELKSRPEVIQVVRDNKALDSLHQEYEKVVIKYEDRIASLTHELQARDRINAQVNSNFQVRLTETEKLLHDKTLENQELEDQNKKLRRKLTLTKVGGLIIIGGIAYLAIDR